MGAQLQTYGIVPESIVDGPGLRYAIFVQGCKHHCPGCHNPESQEREGGTWYDVEDIFEDIRAHRIVKDVTFSGGEPFDQPEALAQLANMLKGAGYGLWCWSGYLFEDLMARDPETPLGAATRYLLETADVLVDGPFVQAQRSLELVWKGSANQRVIDLAATRAAAAAADDDNPAAHVVLWQAPPAVPPELMRRPESW